MRGTEQQAGGRRAKLSLSLTHTHNAKHTFRIKSTVAAAASGRAGGPGILKAKLVGTKTTADDFCQCIRVVTIN